MAGRLSAHRPAGQADDEDDQGQHRGRSVGPLLDLGNGVPSWKKMARGSVAAGSARRRRDAVGEPGREQDRGRVPDPRPKASRTPVRMPEPTDGP